jgi:glutamate-5-semialdehyde dehydrogenase
LSLLETKSFLHLEQQLQKIRKKQRVLRGFDAAKKNQFLTDLSHALVAKSDEVLQANQKDLEHLPMDEKSAFRDRLTLNHSRIGQMAESLRQVANLSDPVGEVVIESTLKNGLELQKVRSPLGVIFMIFESRPNVITEAFSLAFKAGNSIILRGGRESQNTAQVIYSLIRELLTKHQIPVEVFWGVDDYNRELVSYLLQQKKWIDVVVPRGGDQLIEFVQENARMPIIKNDRGMCHAFVDENVDEEMAVNVIINAKTQRPGVCNSLETLLVHEKVAIHFLPKVFTKSRDAQVQWFCDDSCYRLLTQSFPQELNRLLKAEEFHWDTEYLEQKINCRVVPDIEEAIAHIEKHSSRHSEVILTQNSNQAEKFLREVDSAAVYWNASTRFTDGYEFGLGGELGISTQKLHVRGPVGLRELTTPRWIIRGTGQIRK